VLELEIINFKKITKSIIAYLMTQIEEAKKKEESFQMFELEAINLKRTHLEYEE
jgi:hypothetical protein